VKYGYFDDARREYVISTPKTPLPWINYLGSEDFLGMISTPAVAIVFTAMLSFKEYFDTVTTRFPGIKVDAFIT